MLEAAVRVQHPGPEGPGVRVRLQVIPHAFNGLIGQNRVGVEEKESGPACFGRALVAGAGKTPVDRVGKNPKSGNPAGEGRQGRVFRAVVDHDGLAFQVPDGFGKGIQAFPEGAAAEIVDQNDGNVHSDPVGLEREGTSGRWKL